MQNEKSTPNRRRRSLFGGALLNAGLKVGAGAAALFGGGGLASEAEAQCTPEVRGRIDAKAVVENYYQTPFAYPLWDGIAISGDRLYAGVTTLEVGDEFQVLTWDISNPAAPALLGISAPEPTSSLTTIGSPGSGAVAIGETFIDLQRTGTPTGRVRFYGMNNPAAPALLSTLDLPGIERAIVEVGGKLYIQSDFTLYIVDPSDPQNPTILGTLNMTSSGRWGAPVDGILAVHASGTLSLYDVTDPANITVLGFTAVGGPAGSVTIIGNSVIMPSGPVNCSTVIKIVDITDPVNPLPLPDYIPTVCSGPLIASGVFGFTVLDWSQPDDFMAIDVSDPSAPFVAASVGGALQDFESADVASQVLAGGVFAAALHDNDGEYAELRLIDVTDCALLPTIQFSPVSRLVNDGGPDETLTVVATDAFDFQWFKDCAPLSDDGTFSGTTTPSLTIAAQQMAEGVYTCEASNSDGSATSAPTVMGVRSVAAATTGACCLPAGVCMVGTESACTDAGGTYQGDDVTCGESGCASVCLGDMNSDGAINGLDTELFVAALLSGALCP